jgi:hypothetical protein
LLPIRGLSSLIKSYPSVFSKVSPSRTGQVVSIVKLSPRRQRERQGQLIDRQSLQNCKLAHQLCFADALDGHLEGVLAAFRLTDEGQRSRIKGDGHTAVGKALAEASSDKLLSERPH